MFKEAQLRQLVSNVTDAGVTTNLAAPVLPAILVPGNSTTAMTLPRTPAQVLAVVYLGSTSPTPNGFFPLGELAGLQSMYRPAIEPRAKRHLGGAWSALLA